MHPVMKIMAKVHTALYKISGGRIGNSMGGQDILLLHHVGAKSGKKYTSPLGYVRDEDAYVVIAAAAGQTNHPGWYHNLNKSPNTTISIEGEKINVVAEVAPQAKRDTIWNQVAAEIPHFNEYQAMTERIIPVVLLHPENG